MDGWMDGWMLLPGDGVRSSRFGGELCACSPRSTHRVSSAPRPSSEAPTSCRCRCCLRSESTDLGGAQAAASGGARGGHQDYHRAAWTGTPRSSPSPSSSCSQAGSNMASGGETRVSSRRLPNATVTNAIGLILMLPCAALEMIIGHHLLEEWWAPSYDVVPMHQELIVQCTVPSPCSQKLPAAVQLETTLIWGDSGDRLCCFVEFWFCEIYKKISEKSTTQIGRRGETFL